MEEDIKQALAVLNGGGVILYPTDTIWGIGCDATNREAVEKVFKIKNRDKEKSLIALVCSEDMLARWVRNIPQVAWDLIECSEKPTTIIYDDPWGIAPNALADDGSMGIRIVKDEFCRRLIEKLKKPLISTSANMSGEPSPVDFSAISPRICQAVDYVVRWRQQESGNRPASTIIKLTNDSRVRIIRP